MVAFIPRWNGEASIQFKEGFQAGGAGLMTYKKRPGLQFKFGIYYNREFWGNFFIPFLGLDWTINNKQRLFGVLPGYLTYEYRISKRIPGVEISAHLRIPKCLGNYYSLPPISDFIRIDDNQLGVYTDFYLSPKFVLNAEAGYSILRKVRTGYGNTSKDEYIVMSENSAPYVRIALQYRIRLDK